MFSLLISPFWSLNWSIDSTPKLTLGRLKNFRWEAFLDKVKYLVFFNSSMVSIFGLGIGQIILIIGVVLLISFIFFRRYFKALFLDYVVDGLGSFLDNLIGVGAIGLDICDWIAAFWIFRKTKKIVGTAVALFLAWEATNFLPISLIPVVGEGVEIGTGLFPAVFIAILLFNKFRPAEKKERKLEEEISIAEQVGIDVKNQKKILKDIKNLIRKSDPVDALKLMKSKKPLKEVSSKLRDYVDSLVSDTNNIIQYIVKQNIQAPQGIINILQQGINQAGQLMQEAQGAEENEDFGTAINAAANANNIIRSTAQQFDNEFKGWQNEVQQQGQMQPAYAR